MNLPLKNTVKRNDLTIYDQSDPWWNLSDPLLDPLRRLAPSRVRYIASRISLREKSVLDVGCGGGFVSEALAREGALVTGIDIAPGAIAAGIARAHYQGDNIAYRVANAQAIPFPPDSFDSVVCTDVLVHVPKPQLALKEMLRVLKPGGDLFFSSINRTWLATILMITVGEEITGLLPRGTHDPDKFIKPQELRGWLDENGATMESCVGLGPIAWWGGLIFGSYPLCTVMYQGHARLADLNRALAPPPSAIFESNLDRLSTRL